MSVCLYIMYRLLYSSIGNHLFRLLPSGKRFRSMMAKTERPRRSFFPQAIRLLNTNPVSESHNHLQDCYRKYIHTLITRFFCVHTLNNPSAHPFYSYHYLLSPSTLFFFAHPIVLHILLFCTFVLHILLLFLFFYHIYALVLLLLLLLYNSYFLFFCTVH